MIQHIEHEACKYFHLTNTNKLRKTKEKLPDWIQMKGHIKLHDEIYISA